MPEEDFTAELPAELASVVEARRLLARAGRQWGTDEAVLTDSALVVSELVSNSVLHARTALMVRITRLGGGLRIEVDDADRRLPAVGGARPEDLLENRSMTGRGLALVAAMADRWGSDPTPGGKSTWAELGTGGAEPARRPEPGAGTAPSSAPAPPWRASPRLGTSTHDGRRVQLVGVPVALLIESTRQLADLRRELQVMVMGGGAPAELEPVLRAGRACVGDIDLWADTDRRLAEEALASGAPTVDFEVVVPDDIASRIEGLAGWMSRSASRILREHLLTMPATAEVRAYRRWYSEEILRQIGGARPTPCPISSAATT